MIELTSGFAGTVTTQAVSLWHGVGSGLLRLLAQGAVEAPPSAAAAAAGGAARGPGMGDFVGQLLMFGGIFVVFWLLVLRPQQKRAKEHKAFIDALQVGTRVVTNSGIFGKIEALDASTVQLEIAPRTVIKVLRSQVAGVEARATEAVQSAQAR